MSKDMSISEICEGYIENFKKLINLIEKRTSEFEIKHHESWKQKFELEKSRILELQLPSIRSDFHWEKNVVSTPGCAATGGASHWACNAYAILWNAGQKWVMVMQNGNHIRNQADNMPLLNKITQFQIAPYMQQRSEDFKLYKKELENIFNTKMQIKLSLYSDSTSSKTLTSIISAKAPKKTDHPSVVLPLKGIPLSSEILSIAELLQVGKMEATYEIISDKIQVEIRFISSSVTDLIAAFDIPYSTAISTAYLPDERIVYFWLNAKYASPNEIILKGHTNSNGFPGGEEYSIELLLPEEPKVQVDKFLPKTIQIDDALVGKISKLNENAFAELRKSFSRLILKEMQTPDTELYNALFKIDTNFNLLKAYPTPEFHDLHFIKNKDDIIKYLETYSGENIYLQHSLAPSITQLEKLCKDGKIVFPDGKGKITHPEDFDYRNHLLRIMEQIEAKRTNPKLPVDNIETPSGYRTIHLAVWYGNLKLVQDLQALKDTRFDITLVAKNGYTTLHCAAVNGDREMLKFLLLQTASIDTSTTENRQTALHIAASHGHLDAVKLLAERGADFRLPDKDGWTAAELAKAKGYADIAGWLNELDMLSACQEGDLHRMQALKARGVSLNILDKQGNNLLLIATGGNFENIVNFLLKHNPTLLDGKDSNGNTPLHIAAMRGNKEFIDRFLREGLSVNGLNHNGCNALHVAILYQQITVVQHLVSKGIDQAQIGKLYDQVIELTPLEFAISQGNIAATDLLLEKSIVQKKYGSVFHVAIAFDQLAMLDYLLRTGVKNPKEKIIGKTNSEHLTALSYAASLGRGTVVRVLILEHGIPVNSKDKVKGRTALHWAVEKRQKTMVSLLLELGADRTLLDNGKPKYDALALARKLAGEDKDDKIVTIIENFIVAADYTWLIGRPRSSKDIIYQNLVFQGGGVRGTAYVGALEAYAIHGPGFAFIKRVMGTSAGGITAVPIALGMTPGEIDSLLNHTNLLSFVDMDNVVLLREIEAISQDFSFSRLFGYMRDKAFHDLSQFKMPDLSIGSIFGFHLKQSIKDTIKKIYVGAGLSTGERFREWIEGLLKEKTSITHITFREWREQFVNKNIKYKHIYLVCTELTEEGFKPRVFSSEDDPSSDDLIISDVVRCTMSIPGIFQAHKIHRKTGAGKRYPESDTLYVDGGLLRNYAIDHFDRAKYQPELGIDDSSKLPFFNSKTLGFSLVTPKETTEGVDSKTVKGLYEVSKSILYGFYRAESVYAEIRGTDHYRTIYIDDLGIATTEFAISDIDKERLKKSGYSATQVFFDNADGSKKKWYMEDLDDQQITAQIPVMPDPLNFQTRRLLSITEDEEVGEDGTEAVLSETRLDEPDYISDMDSISAFEPPPVTEKIPTSSAASSVSTPFWAKPFGLASSVIDTSLVGAKVLGSGVAGLARGLWNKVSATTPETASSAVTVGSYPAQDALMLLQIPAVKLGQYRDRERPLTAAEQRELKEYHQRLIELQQQLEPYQTALVKADPEFASESQHILKVLKSELIPAIRSGRGSNLLLERVERLMGYLEKRAEAIGQWISSMSSEEKPWIEWEKGEPDEFFTEQPTSRPESFVSQLTSGIGLWHTPRSAAVIDSKPVETTKFQLSV